MGSLSQVVEDCFGVLQVYSDGSIYRARDSEIYKFSDYGDINDEDVAWEDCIFDDQNKLYLRVYKPNNKKNDTIILSNSNNNIISEKKMAIVYYIHGGGFCVGSRTWPNCHHCCLRLSSQLHALVISPDYRLAPEHRLPAAIEDGIEAVKWLQIQAKSRGQFSQITFSKLLDDDCVDFDRVFIMGDSSGGNVAHHLAVHFGPGSPDLNPVRIRGYVLLAPFFGGLLRTRSEAEGPPEPILNVDALDRFWRLALPNGETRDHPLANPLGPNSPNIGMVPLDPILVMVGGKEILKDRVEDYAKRLREQDKDICYVEFEDQHHGFLTNNPYSDVSNQVFHILNKFIMSKTSLLEMK